MLENAARQSVTRTTMSVTMDAASTPNTNVTGFQIVPMAGTSLNVKVSDQIIQLN